MVDELRVWPYARHPFDDGSCHLTTDGSLEDLERFARRLKLKSHWLQVRRRSLGSEAHYHYDLTPDRREAALRLGALFVPAKDQARARLRGVLR
jgi:hypothetical protein